MKTTYIQKHPPQDGKDYEAQCARCGSTWDIYSHEGRGCLSSWEWCKANPLPERELQIPMPEWFEE